MRVNSAKERMLAGEPAFGFGLGLGSPAVAELLSTTGVDFILLDRQHGSWSDESTIAALTAMHAGTAVPMVRVLRNDYSLIGRALDEGFLGIVVPMVNTHEQAAAAAAACRFPPAGERSWGWGRARAYGDDYTDWVDRELFVAVQIETVQAVRNVEAIMATPGIDGCWVGPGDLSLSLGFHPREMDERPEHRAALETVLAACRDTGKIPGAACRSVDDARDRASMGFRFITAAADVTFLADGAARALNELNEVRESVQR